MYTDSILQAVRDSLLMGELLEEKAKKGGKKKW